MRVVKDREAGIVRRVMLVDDHGDELVQVNRFLAPLLAAAQHVQADARHHRGQPAGQVVDLAHIGSAEAQPAFLHRILGFRQGTQHAVGDPPKMRAGGFEFFRQVFFAGHVTSRACASSRS